MIIVTYSEARQHLSKVLNTAKKEGKVLIRRTDGSEYYITPVKKRTEKYNWPGIETGLSRKQILSALRNVGE